MAEKHSSWSWAGLRAGWTEGTASERSGQQPGSLPANGCRAGGGGGLVPRAHRIACTHLSVLLFIHS